MLMLELTLLTALLVGEAPALPPPMVSADAEVKVTPTTSSGAVAAPAALGPGALAFYGLIGAPSLGAGYRQGLAPLELDAEARFNYLELSLAVEGGLRVPIVSRGRLMLAAGAMAGFKFDSGTRYYDKANFSYAALLLTPAAHASYQLNDLVAGVATIEVPWAIALSKTGSQVTPTLGAGAEFHLGANLSLLASLHVGFDAIKEPLGVMQLRAAWGIRLGLGYRLF